MFHDQPDYCRDLERPNLAQIARVAIDRYLYGDPACLEADREYEERDPEGWRRYTVNRTRWRLAREAEGERAEMLREMRNDMTRYLFDGSTCRAVTFPTPTWVGEGDAPWDNTFNLDL